MDDSEQCIHLKSRIKQNKKESLISKKKSPYQREEDIKDFFCGLKDLQQDLDATSFEENCTCVELKSCTSCKSSEVIQHKPCTCFLIPCVCNQLRPVKPEKYNKVHKRIVSSSYDVIHKQLWWRKKSKSKTHVKGKPHYKQFLDPSLLLKPSELLTATSVYKLPEDSDDDDYDDCTDDSNQSTISVYSSLESLDLSGRKSKRRNMKSKQIFTESPKPLDQKINYYNTFIRTETTVKAKGSFEKINFKTLLPGVLLDLYCPKTQRQMKEHLTKYIHEHTTSKEGSRFLDYIIKKHFKKKSKFKLNIQNEHDPCQKQRRLMATKFKKKT